jgi:hypothetical protein
MDNYQKTAEQIVQKPTSIWGLSFEPSLSHVISDDQDHPMFYVSPPHECSDCNLDVVRSVVASFGDRLSSIMEIGISRPSNGTRSLSHVLMTNKPGACIYLGVDIDDRSYIDDAEKNLHTLRADSFDQSTVRAWMRSKGVELLDLLLIDGWHSVNACINDWRYTDLLSEHGVVIMHDTNAHPGCVALFEAVNGAVFDKQRYCTDNDNGIAVLRRLA